MPNSGWIALVATLGVAACSPQMLPGTDVPGNDAVNDTRPNDVVNSDRPTPTDVPNPPDDVPNPSDVPDPMDTPSPSDVVSPPDSMPADVMGMDSVVMPDTGVDSGADSRTDSGSAGDSAPDAAASGCTRTVDGTITLPAAGMSTSVSTTLNALGTGGMNSTTTCVAATAGSERIYRMTVPARTEVIIRATTPVSATDLVLVIRRDCANATAASELACNDDGGLGLNSLIRTFLDPGEYFIVVDERASTAADATGGAVTLQVDTLGPADANSTCAGAISALGMVQTGNTLNGAVPMTTCSSSNNGPQLFYSYTIPSNWQGSFVVTPTGTPAALQPFVRVFADCASAATCLTTGSGASQGAATTAVYENRTAMAQTVIVSVGSTEVGGAGAFSLNGTISPIPPVPANGMCSTPQALTLPAAAVAGSTVGAVERRSYSTCATATSGGQLVYYTVTVPSTRTLRFRVTPGSMTFNPSIRAFNGCAATACADTRDAAPAGQPETMHYYNPSGGDQTLIVAVGSQTDRDQGAFTVDAELLPAGAPTNASCAMASTLMVGTTATAQVQAQATTTSGATCLATSDGPVLYYSVTVPNNTRATVTATPSADRANAVFRVRQSCTNASCVASSNASGGGAVETVSWINTTGAPVTYIVELGSTANSTRGVFDISVSFADATPLYTLTEVPMASCEDMSTGATPVMFPTNDDSSFGPVAFPAAFAFPFFRDVMNTPTHYSITTNGVMQLWPSATGTPTTSAASPSIDLPSTSNPPGLLSAFWDDLLVGPPGSVRTKITGAAPSRTLVVEWNTVTFYLASNGELLTFQIKLFETTGVIEYHYCSMTSMSATSTRHRGDSALVGLQNIPRSEGLRYLVDGTVDGSIGGTVRQVGGGTAAAPSLLRWTPTM